MSHDPQRLMNRRQFAVATTTVAAATTVVNITPGSAQDATPVSDAAPAASEVQVEVVLTGLQDPRFIAIDETGVYFTEAGSGGETEVFEIPGEGTPAAIEPISMFGTTGKLSRLEADGMVTIVVDGFASYTFGANGEIVGAAGVALDGTGRAYVATGAPGPFISHIELTGQEGALFEIDLATGEKRLVADLAQYEIAHNPDPATVDSNLYGVAVREGIAYVADAGGNDILAVDIASGEITTFAVTAGLEAPFLPESGNPNRGGELTIDSVPSGLAISPDDRLYVTYVTGAPFPTGLSPIDAFTLDGEKETFATGLTMVTDIAFASDGTPYAVIMSADLVNGGPGKIVRVMADGSHMVVVDNLQFPNGIAFDADDTLYVTHKASLALPGGGEMLKITGVTSATGIALTPPSDTVVVDATPATGSGTKPETVHVQLGDMFFEPSAISIPADTEILFTFENTGFMQHDFFVGGVNLHSGMLGGGQTSEMLVNLPAGTYEFWCTQVGHRSAGMLGTLTVG